MKNRRTYSLPTFTGPFFVRVLTLLHCQLGETEDTNASTQRSTTEGPSPQGARRIGSEGTYPAERALSSGVDGLSGWGKGGILRSLICRR